MLPADQSVVVVLANTVLRKLKFECWGEVFESLGKTEKCDTSC